LTYNYLVYETFCNNKMKDVNLNHFTEKSK